MRLPLLLHLRFPTNEGSYGLWLPWFLIYPILLILMLLALPFVLIATIVLLPMGKAKPLIMAGPYLWRLIAALGGLRAEVQTDGHKILVNFV